MVSWVHTGWRCGWAGEWWGVGGLYLRVAEQEDNDTQHPTHTRHTCTCSAGALTFDPWPRLATQSMHQHCLGLGAARRRCCPTARTHGESCGAVGWVSPRQAGLWVLAVLTATGYSTATTATTKHAAHMLTHTDMHTGHAHLVHAGVTSFGTSWSAWSAGRRCWLATPSVGGWLGGG